MLSLSKALMDATIKVPDISIKELRHGLSIDRTERHGRPYEQVKIEEQGFFIRFCLSYVDQKDYETHLEGYNGLTYFLPPKILI